MVKNSVFTALTAALLLAQTPRRKTLYVIQYLLFCILMFFVSVFVYVCKVPHDTTYGGCHLNKIKIVYKVVTNYIACPCSRFIRPRYPISESRVVIYP